MQYLCLCTLNGGFLLWSRSCVLYSTAGNESCPQPQTSEHLAAIEIMRLRHIIILQNKIDIIKESQAQEQYQDIVRFVQGQYLSLLSILLCFPILFT